MGKIKKRKLIFRGGYAIFELLFYIAFFSVLSVVMINSLLAMTKSFKETGIQAELAQSGAIMERISREIRQAKDISSISATSLELDGFNSSGDPEKKKFSFSEGNVEFFEGGVLVGNLNSPKIVVAGLNFVEISTNKSKAVKAELSIRSLNDTSLRIRDFYDTVVLRGGY